MKIRKVVYNVDYIHLLKFKENYKSIIAPYFTYEPLQYAIDNENTMHEGIRLIFKSEGFGLQFKKEGIVLHYEGNVADVKRNNPVIDIFFDIYEKIKKIEGFSRTKRHKILIEAVDIMDKQLIQKILEKNDYLINPFGKLDEFATVFEFENNSKKVKLQFGNYSEKDIQVFNLNSMNTEYNEDLKGNVGLFSQTTISEEVNHSSFSKFKELLKDGEGIIESYTGYFNKANENI